MILLEVLLSAVGSILATLALGVNALVGALSGTVAYVPPLPAQTTTQVANSATTTPFAVVTETDTREITPVATTSKAKPTPAAAATTPAPSLPPPSSTLPTKTAEAVNTETRASLVNILCTTKAGGSFRPISGSGIIIDSRGIILTNAHIGQFFLLKDYPMPNNVDCVIRTGNPARPAYRAALLYLPTAWITANASQLTAAQAKGTGEHDYAFLAITASVNEAGMPLPQSFPAVAMTSADTEFGEHMLLASYPAGFLGGISIEKDLYSTSAYATVKELFTFGTENTVDLISVGGTVVSQSGSSGGATVRLSDGKLIGLIATATLAETTAARDLRAITIAHINRSLATHGKGGISQLLSQDINAALADFAANVAPGEKQTLIDAL